MTIQPKRTVWRRGDILDSYYIQCSVGISSGTLVMIEVLCGFPQSLQGDSGAVAPLGHNLFLPNAFKFVVHQLCYLRRHGPAVWIGHRP
jgi:hypothetical protein